MLVDMSLDELNFATKSGSMNWGFEPTCVQARLIKIYTTPTYVSEIDSVVCVFANDAGEASPKGFHTPSKGLAGGRLGTSITPSWRRRHSTRMYCLHAHAGLPG
jgi:hypothetical protein